MMLPLPARGSIIRYSYLWADEYRRGAEEGLKERPVLVLALSVIDRDGHAHALVLPITHSPPSSRQDAVELPVDAKRTLKLDDLPSWIVVTEANAFVWPGPDIRPIPGRRERTPVYGVVPPALLTQVAKAYLAARQRGLQTLVTRS